ncbi:hypothetical protein C4513_00180 [Morganella morganii]|nr:hypothetical protein [Morganella morganii]MQC09346.1 hypothetical protein [Morganella morganii]MQC13064.1 hypothetical protein [Morganella morganii]
MELLYHFCDECQTLHKLYFKILKLFLMAAELMIPVICRHKKSAHRALFLYLSDFNQNALLYFAMIAAARVRLEKKVLMLFIMNSCF